MRSSPQARLRLGVAAAIASVAPTIASAADTDTDRNVQVHVGQQLSREQNLYRLPPGVEPAELLGTEAARDDRLATTSAGLAGHWQQGKQEVALDVSAAANRFSTNSDLDNTSGKGALGWDWQLGSRWSGQVGGQRELALASFANTRSLEKDLLDTSAYRGAAQFDFGPRWRASASARSATTTHDNEARSRDDAEVNGAAISLEYHTPSANSLGVEFRGARATFPQAVGAGMEESAADYEEHAASVNLSYVMTDKALLKTSIGYVDRAYPLAADADFSGNVWSAMLQWSPTQRAQLALQRWRELRAHFDSESDHFVSTGSGVQATWEPADGFTMSVQWSREDQRYIGIAADADFDPSRHDLPLVRTLVLGYAPGDHASLELTYRSETRDSNRLWYDYDATTLGIGCELRF